MLKFLLVAQILCIFNQTPLVFGQNFYKNLRPEDAELSFQERQFRVVYEWRTLDYAYVNEYERGRARQSGDYIDENILISDVKAFAGRLYVTTPRMMPGVPATLGWIISPDNNGKTDPYIEPYPSWEMNKLGDCRALQFVQGIAIDADGVLWVVDSGRVNTLRPARPSTTCPPKLVLLDLKQNGTIIQQYEFPEEVVARGTNYLNKIVVDDAYGGFGYITDNSGSDPGIVVYSRRLGHSWKVREPNSMRAALNAVDFAVNGTSLRFSIHIDGIALGPPFNPTPNVGLGPTNPIFNGPGADPGLSDRNVYYSPLSSYHLYSIPASVLRDPDFNRKADPRQVFQSVTDYGLKVSQTDGMIMDNRGVLYYGLLKEHALARWDSYEPFTTVNQHIIAKDDDYIQWVDGMTFDENGYLYIVVNRLYNFVSGRLNPNEVNFRILRGKVGGKSYVYTNTAADPLSNGLYPSGIGADRDRFESPFYYANQNNLIGYSSASKTQSNCLKYFSLILLCASTFTFLR